jgi:cytochrome c
MGVRVLGGPPGKPNLITRSCLAVWMIHMKYRVICLGCLAVIALALSSCSGEVNGVPEPFHASSSAIASGRRLIAGYGCGSCHSIPGVPGANSMAGPPLKCFYQRSYIAGHLPNTRDNLILWVRHPQQVEPGTAMPDLGVTEDEAADIAAYLYDPQDNLGLNQLLERKCSQ